MPSPRRLRRAPHAEERAGEGKEGQQWSRRGSTRGTRATPSNSRVAGPAAALAILTLSLTAGGVKGFLVSSPWTAARAPLPLHTKDAARVAVSSLSSSPAAAAAATAARAWNSSQRPRRSLQRPPSLVYAVPGGAEGEGDFEAELSEIDDEQAGMMQEMCIVVDREDVPVGRASKVHTHLNKMGLPLHRAFSIFLFDSQGRMLLQQRASSKHTFPLFWTNTCCSHPLWNEEEMGIKGASSSSSRSSSASPEEDGGGISVELASQASVGEAAIGGSEIAAVRKLGQELGIPAGELHTDRISYLTKIHYIADSNGVWGEHEIDYVYIITATDGKGDFTLAPNPNEVEATRYVTATELRAMLQQVDDGEIEFTPWSRHIIDQFVFDWWPKIEEGPASLRALREPPSVIHRMGKCQQEEEEEEEEEMDMEPQEVGGAGTGAEVGAR